MGKRYTPLDGGGWAIEWSEHGIHLAGIGATKEEARQDAIDRHLSVPHAERQGHQEETVCGYCETETEGLVDSKYGPVCGKCSFVRGLEDPSKTPIGIVPPASFEDAIGRIQEEMLDIMLSKRALRGTENITRQGIYGVATRMAEDKLARIQKAVDKLYAVHLLEKIGMGDLAGEVAERVAGQEMGEDSLDDDLKDTANYAIICLLLRRGWWELPTRAEIGENHPEHAHKMHYPPPVRPWPHIPRPPWMRYWTTAGARSPWLVAPILDKAGVIGYVWKCSCSNLLPLARPGEKCTECGAVVPAISDLSGIYDKWLDLPTRAVEDRWCPIWSTGEE